MTTKGDTTDGAPEDQDPAATRFLVDGTAGRLARWLRLLGFDTAYCECAADYRLAHLARVEGRVLLTRRKPASALPWAPAVLLESDSLEEQLVQVARLYPLPDKPLTRCSSCNSPLADVPRESVRGRVPPFVYETAPAFSRCSGCGHLYWPGTHHAGISERWARLRELSSED